MKEWTQEAIDQDQREIAHMDHMWELRRQAAESRWDIDPTPFLTALLADLDDGRDISDRCRRMLELVDRCVTIGADDDRRSELRGLVAGYMADHHQHFFTDSEGGDG